MILYCPLRVAKRNAECNLMQGGGREGGRERGRERRREGRVEGREGEEVDGRGMEGWKACRW